MSVLFRVETDVFPTREESPKTLMQGEGRPASRQPRRVSGIGHVIAMMSPWDVPWMM